MAIYMIVKDDYEKTIIPVAFNDRDLAQKHANNVDGTVREITLLDDLPQRIPVFTAEAYIKRDKTDLHAGAEYMWDYEVESADPPIQEPRIWARKYDDDEPSGLVKAIKITGIDAQRVYDQLDQYLTDEE